MGRQWYMHQTVTPAELNYSNSEHELLALVSALKMLNNYIFVDCITVQTDHEPLGFIWKRFIASANPRLPKLLLRYPKYNLEFFCLKGKLNVIAEALSCIPPCRGEHSASSVDCLPVHLLTATVRASEQKLQDLRVAIQTDRTYIPLKHIIFTGWLGSRAKWSTQLLDCWNYRVEMKMENCLVFRGYLLGTRENYGPTAQHTQDFPIFFIQLNYVYK